MNSPTATSRLIWVLSVLVTLSFWVFSGRIDFHPDEAIYFEGIPPNVRNDTGAFYIALYSAVTAVMPGPQGARLASALLGGGFFAALALTLERLGNASRGKIILLFAAFLISYQAIFVFVRVRPEAAWWLCSALVFYATACVERAPPNRLAWLGLLAAALLLPMNHRLSWFACAFYGGYVVLFMGCDLGWKKAAAVLAALVLGAVLNVVVRGWWADVPLAAAAQGAMTSSGGVRQPFGEFARLVFDGAPSFLNDVANNPNLYERAAGLRLRWISHSYLQNALWLMMLVLPFMGRTWKERYVLTFPLFAFAAFWFSGYYNPTYAAGFSLYCLMALAFLAFRQRGAVRGLAVAGLVLSMVNGASFLATRVLNHGPATYFETEVELEAALAVLAPGAKVAVPERFTPSVRPGLHRTVNFKEAVPQDVDLLVTDSYDRLMYGFVPDFEQKKRDIQKQAESMCLLKQTTYPVYRRDSLFAQGSIDAPSSWFFRNSASYALSLYKKCDGARK